MCIRDRGINCALVGDSGLDCNWCCCGISAAFETCLAGNICVIYVGCAVFTDKDVYKRQALDNAVTAAGQYDGKRFIEVATEKKHDMLLITVDLSLIHI